MRGLHLRCSPFSTPSGGFGRCPRGHSLLGAGFRLAVALSAIPLLYPWLLASVSLGMLGCCSLLTTWLVTPWFFFRSVMALRATGNAQTSPAETMSPRAPGTARNGFRGHPAQQETVSEGTRHSEKRFPRAPGTARNGFRGHPALQELVSKIIQHRENQSPRVP